LKGGSGKRKRLGRAPPVCAKENPRGGENCPQKKSARTASSPNKKLTAPRSALEGVPESLGGHISRFPFVKVPENLLGEHSL